MENFIIILVIAIIIIAAVGYIIRQKKKGKHCIGCPYAENCNKQNHCDK
ncbi:MAG: FeoB-associated Cys-rich membrane protein [Clostridia bacterium]|nr:FeoB-associated Cys-rich membrane protein [Clostridia bacterium]